MTSLLTYHNNIWQSWWYRTHNKQHVTLFYMSRSPNVRLDKLVWFVDFSEQIYVFIFICWTDAKIQIGRWTIFLLMKKNTSTVCSLYWNLFIYYSCVLNLQFFFIVDLAIKEYEKIWHLTPYISYIHNVVSKVLCC